MHFQVLGKSYANHMQNISQTYAKHGPNMCQPWAKHGPNMGQAWTKHEPNMGQTWGQTWARHGANMRQIYAKHEPNMGPNMGQTWADCRSADRWFKAGCALVLSVCVCLCCTGFSFYVRQRCPSCGTQLLLAELDPPCCMPPLHDYNPPHAGTAILPPIHHSS